MRSIVGLSGAALGTVLALGLTTPHALAGDGHLWKLESDGSWSGSRVALGNDGTQIFTLAGSYGSYAQMISAHDSDPPAPVWEDYQPGAATRVSLDSASAAGVHVVVHQTMEGLHLAGTLRKFSSTSVTADWSWSFPYPFLGGFAGTAVSDDGQRIVAVGYDFTTTKNRLAVFGPDSDVPIVEEELPIFMPIRHFVLSGDGSTLCAVSDTSLLVYDLSTSTLLHSHYLFFTPNLNALALSRDGTVLVFGTLEEVQVFERGETQYVNTYSYTQPAGSWSDTVAISSDGSTMACGVWIDGGPSGLHVAAVDLASEVVLTSRDFSAENGNLFGDLSICDDGSRFAVGFTGGDGTQGEEVLVFETALDTRIEAFDLVGLVNDLEISPDGTVVAVAHSGSNDNAYTGGAIALFEIAERGLALHGVPVTGATVSFIHRVEGGGIAQLMLAASLDDPPTVFPGAGVLYLDRPNIILLPPGAPGVETGTFETLFTILDSPGTTLYFQSMAFGPDELSRNYVKLTVLP